MADAGLALEDVFIGDRADADLIAGALIFAIVANGARRILRISR